MVTDGNHRWIRATYIPWNVLPQPWIPITNCCNHFQLLKYQAPPVLSSLISKKDQDASGSAGMNSLRALALLGAGVSGLLSFTTIASADEAEHGLECPNYPWPHQGILSSYDHAS